jgi:hypothetical protein
MNAERKNKQYLREKREADAFAEHKIKVDKHSKVDLEIIVVKDERQNKS